MSDSGRQLALATAFDVRSYGAKVDGATDDSVAFTNACQASFNAGGAVYIPQGTIFLAAPHFATFAAVQAPLGGVKIVGADRDLTTIKLGGTILRFMDIDDPSHTDTLVSNVKLWDLTVDGTALGSSYQFVTSNIRHGLRTSFAHFEWHRVRSIAAAGSTAVHVYIQSVHSASGQTLSTITDFIYDDLECINGITGSTVSGSGATPTNCFIDRMSVPKFRHTTGQVGLPAGSNMLFGSEGFCGRIDMGEVHAEMSSDVGVEIDNCQSLYIKHIEGIDNQNGLLFLHNFGDALGQAQLPAQQAVIDYVHHRNLTVVNTAGQSGAVSIAGAPIANQYGDLKVGTIQVSKDNVTGSVPLALNLQAGGSSFKSIDIDEITVSSLFVNDAVTAVSMGIISASILSDCRLRVGSLRAQMAGTYTAMSITPIVVEDAAASPAKLSLEIDSMDLDISGAFSQVIEHVGALAPNAELTLSGYIRRLRVRSSQAPSQGSIRFGSGLAFIAPFLIENCDWSGLAGGSEVVYQGVNQQQNVIQRSNAYKTKPAPSNLTGLVTGTGIVSGRPYACDWVFTQGSGAGITAIDYSINGGTTYTNFLTQASGALPAGFNQVLSGLPPSALVRVTFTTTQPTITLVPHDP